MNDENLLQPIGIISALKSLRHNCNVYLEYTNIVTFISIALGVNRP